MINETIRRLLSAVFEEDSIRCEPVDVSPRDGTGGRYSISGKIRVPHASGRKFIELHAVITLKMDDGHGYPVVDCEGKAILGIWEIAKGIVISDGCIRLVNKNGRVVAQISGALRYSDGGNFETGGTLDAAILCDQDDPDRMYIGTLVKDAWLNIGRDIHLCGATIRFESCTKPPEPGLPLPYGIDEMDEYLFQCTRPVPLSLLFLTGLGEKPVTMSISINALDPYNVRTGLTVYPARLRVPGLGENTILFISGPMADQPFTIDTAGEWSAAISSNPCLHCVSPGEPGGPSLVEGVAFFIGKLEGKGFSSARLSVSSELTNAIAFPQSRWPQQMPDQRISLSVSEEGATRLDLVFNPLLFGDLSISGTAGEERPIHASLRENGLSFGEGCRVTRESPGRQFCALPSFAIDNRAGISIEENGKKVEIGDWLSEQSL